ncbi:MAG: hypothetical protein GEU80_15750 [Dehalococcoidia bacterium]|nr:hypothetical protein [Dehalococcoidia bacterium]
MCGVRFRVVPCQLREAQPLCPHPLDVQPCRHRGDAQVLSGHRLAVDEQHGAWRWGVHVAVARAEDGGAEDHEAEQTGDPHHTGSIGALAPRPLTLLVRARSLVAHRDFVYRVRKHRGARVTYRFETTMPLRHTDSFGGTPFVHGGVLLALTEIALDAYDREAGVPSHREVLRFQSHSEVRYRSPLRWDDAAIVRLRCAEVQPGRLLFECEVAAASDGRVVAQFKHRYAYVNASTGRPETPDDWDAVVAAIQGYEPSPPGPLSPAGGEGEQEGRA